MTASPNPDLEVLARDLESLASSVAAEEPTEIGEARDAIRRATEGDPDRALLLARMAVDRARRALGKAGDPRPVAVAPRTPDVELDSEIPDGHPAKSAIESSVAGAFVGVKGRWRVAILVQPNAPWWGIRVEGASICWTGTLEGPDEQCPEFLAGRVREAVRLGVMQAALPRHRGRG